MTHNFVRDKKFWDNAAINNPFSKICSKFTEEKFWNHQPNVSNWGLNKDMSFLDVGCGIGRIVRTISPLVKNYTGVDISNEMIEKAKKYHSEYTNINFLVINGKNLDIFEKDIFDFVYSCLVFIHVDKESIISYVRDIYRVLKPNGIYFTSTFPKAEKYMNGFSLEEIYSIFNNYNTINISEHGEYYYFVRATK